MRITSVQRPLPLPSPDQCQRGQLGTRRYPPDRAATSEPDLSPGACAPPSCPPCVPPEVSVLDPAQQGSPAGRCDLQPQAVCAGNPAGLSPPPPGAPTLFPASQKAPGKQDGHCIVPTHRPPRAGPWHACQPDTHTCALCTASPWRAGKSGPVPSPRSLWLGLSLPSAKMGCAGGSPRPLALATAYVGLRAEGSTKVGSGGSPPAGSKLPQNTLLPATFPVNEDAGRLAGR